MCLLIFAHHAVPGFPLVLAANRDEFHDRPTAASRFWPEHPHLLAGRDLSQGGTWMGLTRGGRFAALTNFRDPARTAPAPRSRGELPLGFLLGRDAPGDYLQRIAQAGAQYAGFNLLVGDADQLWYANNTDGDAPERLRPGIYGLSNARLDTPWPKVVLGKARLADMLAAGEPAHDRLAEVVSDRRLAGPREPEMPAGTNGMDHLLSAQFIVTERYGTRCTTTLYVAAGRRASWRERSYDRSGVATGDMAEDFTLGDG